MLLLCVILSLTITGDFLYMPQHSQHFNVGSMLFQRCGSTLKWRWSDVENETKSDVGFSTLHNFDTTSVPGVKQRRSNVGTTLIQRCFNLASTLVKATLNPIGLMMIMDLQNRWIVFIRLNEKTFFTTY